MPKPREPIELIQAKGRKNLTKKEIEERRAREVKPCVDGIVAPSYLTPAQRQRFDVLAGQLKKINILGETDVDTLARYVAAQALYERLTKEVRALVARPPKETTDDAIYYTSMEKWTSAQDSLMKQQDRYFKQAHACASALGLTITSRCRLEVPVKQEEVKVNKFAKFGEGDIQK